MESTFGALGATFASMIGTEAGSIALALAVAISLPWALGSMVPFAPALATATARAWFATAVVLGPTIVGVTSMATSNWIGFNTFWATAPGLALVDIPATLADLVTSISHV